jgi:hypothetical protein
MATTFRRRHNLLSNTLGAALTTGSTSITFGSALQEGGSNIATLGTDEYLPLTIESEVVYLTAYTAGATSGTVVRARENTVDPGVSHANGTAVKNAPTKRDALKVRRTRIRGQGSMTTTSTSYVTIDATKLPYLYLDLLVGDLVEMTLSGQMFSNGSDNCEFDFEVDTPTGSPIADGRVNSDAANGLGLNLFRGDRTIIFYRTTFIAGEAGLHGFRPVWKTRGGSTLTLSNATSDPNDSVVEQLVVNLGTQGV